MQILKEDVLCTRGNFVIKARVVVYHSGTIRTQRTELHLEKFQNNNPQQEVGFTTEELIELHNMLVKWKEKNKVNIPTI
jgi:hypothetical protein